MMGRIELKAVNALLGYCRDMPLSFDHIKSDEYDEGRRPFCGCEIGLRRLEAAFCDPISGPITTSDKYGEKEKPERLISNCKTIGVPFQERCLSQPPEHWPELVCRQFG